MGAEKVICKSSGSDGWVYLLQHDTPIVFDKIHEGLQNLDAYLLQQERFGFARTVFHPLSSTNDDKIRIGANHVLLHHILNAEGEPIDGTESWQMRDTKPPRKRVINESTQAVIPDLKPIYNATTQRNTTKKTRRANAKPSTKTQSKAMHAAQQAHAKVLAEKDATITALRTMQTTMEETISTQTALIMALQSLN
jgi:hypothetical protein